MNRVQLLDGREVDSASYAWLLECRDRDAEARSVLAMPHIETRRAHLQKYESRHGAEARRRLEGVIRQIWDARRAAADAARSRAG